MVRPISIGALRLNTNILLAPMAGITNLPARLVARDCGASLCFTEMVSINGLVREGKKSLELVEGTPEDRPLGVQIFGDDPQLMAEAARIVAPYGDLIDINMGCPVRKVVNSGAGSALLRDPLRVRDIIRSTRRAVELPLTVKIRSGWQCGEENYLEIARIAEDEGCDAVTLHPRTRSQMFEGKADWDKIRILKESVKIPVIGSGDLFTGADVTGMLAETGCDAVMVARGGMGNPWIFREAAGAPAPTPAERLAVALRHMELFCEHQGEGIAVREMRKHFSWYAKGIPGAATFRNAVNRIDRKDELVELLHGFFQGACAAC